MGCGGRGNGPDTRPDGEAGLTGAPPRCSLRPAPVQESTSFHMEAAASRLQKARGEPALRQGGSAASTCPRSRPVLALSHPPVSTGLWAVSPSHPVGRSTPPGPTTDPPSGAGPEATSVP